MPWNGSAPNKTFGRSDGTRTGTQVWQQAEADGVDIISPDHDTHDQDLADGINATLRKDGGNTASNNLPMGGYHHTEVGDALEVDQYATLGQMAKNGGLYVANVGGTANAITLTTTYSIASIVEGHEFSFIVSANNTEPATVAVDGLAAKSITRPDGSALEDGDLYAGAIATIRYDGTQFQLLNRRVTDGGAGGEMTGAEIVSALNAELGSDDWQDGAVTAALPVTFSDVDARVVGIGQVNEYGGGGCGEYTVRVTADGRIIVVGDTGGLGIDSAGDNYGPFELDWDRANNGEIERVYQGTDYILIQTDQSAGNLWSVGLNATYGVLGHGDTTARRSPTRIAYFNTTVPSRISMVWTECGTNLNDRFWFAIDTSGNLFSCGSGLNYTQGGNSTAHVTTPRPVTQSDGTTQLTGIVEVSCCSAIAPVFARTSSGTLWRWGAGTSGAAGQGAATDITWPAILGGGTPTTGITKAVTTGSNINAARSASAIIQSGVLKVAGDRTNGIGDGTTSGTPITAFTTVSGSLASLTVVDVAAGGGEYPIFGAIDSRGDLWLAGYGDNNIYGAGANTAANNTFANPTLPTTASATVTISNASPAVVTWTGHRHKNGDRVHFTTSGSLPSGITANTTYYVVNASVSAGTFQVSETSGGAAVNTGSVGSGTHTGKVNFTAVRIGGFNAANSVYAEANGVVYAIGDDALQQTGQNTASAPSTKATRTWQVMQGQAFANSDWQVVGPRTLFGLNMLCTNGSTRYCGANAQGQGGVQPSNLHSVPYLQMTLPAGPRLLKPLTPRGGYNSGTEYSYNDVVIDGGSTYAYVSETASTGTPTSNTSVWTLLVQGASAASVTAAANFDTDNVLVRADGTSKGAQKGLWVNDDLGHLYPATHDTGGLGTITRGIADLFMADGFVLSITNGTTAPKTITEASGVLTFAGLYHKLAAGTASVAPLQLQSGTNLTAAAAGAIEFDGKAIYATAVASSRQVVPATQISVLASDFTGVDNGTAQPVFSAAQDTLTVAASTTYRFRAHYWITRGAGTTSHTTAVLFGGTATFTAIEYMAKTAAPNGNALGAISAIIGNAASAVTVTAANTNGSENLMIELTGTFCVNGAGTIIPQFQYSTGPGGAPTVKRGSFIELWPIGSDSVATIGNWS